jgi:hypothetical protein
VSVLSLIESLFGDFAFCEELARFLKARDVHVAKVAGPSAKSTLLIERVADHPVNKIQADKQNRSNGANADPIQRLLWCHFRNTLSLTMNGYFGGAPSGFSAVFRPRLALPTNRNVPSGISIAARFASIFSAAASDAAASRVSSFCARSILSFVDGRATVVRGTVQS